MRKLLSGYGDHFKVGLATLSLLAVSAGAVQAQALPRYNVAPSMPAAQVSSLEAQRSAMLSRILANPADLDANFAYAMLSTQLGDLEAAIATLERMRIYAPDVPRLRLELATLYARLGATELARQHLLAVRDLPDTPPEVEANIDQALAGLDGQAGGPRLSGHVTLGALYSSNANSGPNDRVITLNGFEARLDDVAIGTPDAKGALSGGVRLVQPMAGGNRLEVSFSGTIDAYSKRNDLSAGGLDARVGAVMSLDRLGLDGATISFNAFAGTNWLGSEPNLNQVGLATTLDIPLSSATLLSTSYSLRHEDFLVSSIRPRADLRDGLRQRAGIALYHTLSSDWQAMTSLNVTRKDAVAGYQAYWEPGVSAGLSHRFKPDTASEQPWIFTINAGASLRSNDAPDLMVNALQAQKGLELSLQASQTIPLKDQLSLQVQAGYRHIFSNYDTRSMGEASLGVSLSYSF